MARWEAEYNQLMNSERDEFGYDYGAALNEAWKDDITHETAIKFDGDGLPILGEYVFGERRFFRRSSLSNSIQKPRTNIWIPLLPRDLTL